MPSGLASVRDRVAVVFIFVKFVGSVKDDFKSSVGDMKCTFDLIYQMREPRGALPIMAYMGRLRPKAVPFLGFRYIKG